MKRRKPYIIIGLLLAVAVLLAVICTSVFSGEGNSVKEESTVFGDSRNGFGKSGQGSLSEEERTESEIEGMQESFDTGTDNAPAIICEHVDAHPGEKVQVKVSIRNNPGILGMALSVYYDEKNLRLVSVENGAAFAGILDLTSSHVLVSGSKFVWDEIDIKDSDIKDGEILVMTFKVADNANKGEYAIALKCLEGDAVDKNLNNVILKTANNYISVH